MGDTERRYDAADKAQAIAPFHCGRKYLHNKYSDSEEASKDEMEEQSEDLSVDVRSKQK